MTGWKPRDEGGGETSAKDGDWWLGWVCLRAEVDFSLKQDEEFQGPPPTAHTHASSRRRWWYSVKHLAGPNHFHSE